MGAPSMMARVVLAALLHAADAFHCHHDDIPLVMRLPYRQAAQRYEHRGRRATAAEATHSPLRVQVIEVSTAALSTSDRSYLLDTLVPTAVATLSMTLAVEPVQGALLANRTCSSSYSISGVCAAEGDPVRCGLAADGSNAAVDISLLRGLETCATCYGDGSCDPSSCTTSADGAGVADADFVLFVSAVEHSAVCGSSTMAFASACVRDQYDRPILGHTNFCPSSLSAAAADWDQQLATALHEILHALGVSSPSAHESSARALPSIASPPEGHSRLPMSSPRGLLECSSRLQLERPHADGSAMLTALRNRLLAVTRSASRATRGRSFATTTATHAHRARRTACPRGWRPCAPMAPRTRTCVRPRAAPSR